MEQTPSVPQGEKPDRFLATSILASALIIGGALIYSTNVKNNTTPNPTPKDNPGTAIASVTELGPRDVILGDPNAPVLFVEYGDYQCPFCARFFMETEKQIRDNYIESGKVKMVYRDFAFLSQESYDAAEAAECAKDQGKFWAFHDALFEAEHEDGVEHNGNLNRTLFMKIANDLKMDAGKFASCYDGNTYANEVTQSYNAASQVGVRGTPATYVNGVEVAGGARPYAEYRAIFDQYLNQN